MFASPAKNQAAMLRKYRLTELLGEGKFLTRALLRFVCFGAAAFCLTCVNADIVVNSLADVEVPNAGEVTLRSALEMAASGEPITFDPSLDGGTIELSIVGEEHTTLFAELMGGHETPSGYISYLIGYFERNYGRSALYAQKDVVIDASSLPNGLTIKWTGGIEDPARVLAVLGDLTMRNVSVTGGRSVSVELEPDLEATYPQHSTRARGGGLAVWGIATLENCRLFDNGCFQKWSMKIRDSREGGVFGGGIYADVVLISDCVISGNSLEGAGVSGGGVFTLGGRSTDEAESILERTSLTGNSIAGIFAYGAGVYSDGGGIGKLKALTLVNCTVATNEVGIYGPGFLYGSGYWRGGGVYMSNGFMELRSCTIVDNAVTGVPRTDDLDKPNLAGGICATIGNAHAVEHMIIGHCIIAGNWVYPYGGDAYSEDIFTGSLSEFISEGYNCIGVINFNQMLVPDPDWQHGTTLVRKHYPKAGDQYGVDLDDVLYRNIGTMRSPDIMSLGVDTPQYAVLRYTPKGSAIDQVPTGAYTVESTRANYSYLPNTTDNFKEIILGRIEDHYGLNGFADSFTADFEAFLASVDLDDDRSNGLQPYTTPGGDPVLKLEDAHRYAYGQANWPSLIENYPHIEFWHHLDAALRAADIPELGPELLGDTAWDALFDHGALEENYGISFGMYTEQRDVQIVPHDQTQEPRPVNSLGDIGAVEYLAEPPWGKFVSITTGAGTHSDTTGWLGILETSLDPWDWCLTISSWLHIPTETATSGQGWIYPPDPDALLIEAIEGTDWGYSDALETWVMLTDGGWLFVM